MMIWDRQTSCNGSYRGQNIVHLPIETGPGQTDPLMEGHKFRSGLTEVTGDGTYICITMSQICFETLTNNSPSRAASSQLKTQKYTKNLSNLSNLYFKIFPGNLFRKIPILKTVIQDTFWQLFLFVF